MAVDYKSKNVIRYAGGYNRNEQGGVSFSLTDVGAMNIIVAVSQALKINYKEVEIKLATYYDESKESMHSEVFQEVLGRDIC